MFNAKTAYSHHLDHLRAEAANNKVDFQIVLRMVIKDKDSQQYLLADAMLGKEATEERLIEKYRVQFYEWLANTALATSAVDKDMVEKKARQMVSQANTEKARRAANARHGKPDGSRQKQEDIRKIWATGKYSTRDRCAEEEYAALGISFSTARRALQNTPNPDEGHLAAARHKLAAARHR